MSSYDEKLASLKTRLKQLSAQELELMKTRESLCVEVKSLEAEWMIQTAGLTHDQVRDFRKAVTQIVKTLSAEDVIHAVLEIVNAPPDTEPRHHRDAENLYSIHMTCMYSVQDRPVTGFSYTVEIKTQNAAIIAILQSMIKQVGQGLEESVGSPTRWFVYWDDYQHIVLNDAAV